MRPHEFTPRADYRQQESQRTNESVSLAEKYRELKSLTVEFGYFSPEGITRNHQIKYTVNPEHAKSVFRLDCANQECVGGDIDLSDDRSRRGRAPSHRQRRNVLAGLAQQDHHRPNPLPQYPAL